MILAIDTATRWLGLALHDGKTIITEEGWRSVNTQTIDLAPAVATILACSGITAANLKAIAIAIGPGSYTGLRVGLGLAKGMALAYQTPLIGIPTLDIVAASFCELPGDLIVTAEAGRTRILVGRFQWTKRYGWQTDERPELTTWAALLDAQQSEATFAGEITEEAGKAIRNSGKPFTLAPPAACVRRAGYLAELGWRHWRKKKIDNPAALVPDYLREPAGA